MKKTAFIYALLFSIPALLAALIISTLLFGATAGMLWMFVFGDAPWPASANLALTAGFCLVFSGIWLGGMFAAFWFGKKQKNGSAINLQHAMASIRATLLLAVIILGYQLHVGNIGPKTEATMCAEFCMAKDFSASMMLQSDKNAVMCSCLDAQGNTRLKTSIGEVMLQQQQVK